MSKLSALLTQAIIRDKLQVTVKASELKITLLCYIIDNQRNGLEMQAKALMTSVIRPDTLYFGIL